MYISYQYSSFELNWIGTERRRETQNLPIGCCITQLAGYHVQSNGQWPWSALNSYLAQGLYVFYVCLGLYCHEIEKRWSKKLRNCSRNIGFWRNIPVQSTDTRWLQSNTCSLPGYYLLPLRHNSQWSAGGKLGDKTCVFLTSDYTIATFWVNEL